MTPMQPDKNFLIALAHTQMPFGKYKDYYLVDLPLPYLVWFQNKGFPKGKLGTLLQTVFEIKQNGLEDLVRTIKTQHPKKG